MARQPATKTAAKKATAKPKEDTVTATATDAPAETTSAPAQNTEATEAVVDTKAFDEAIQKAIAEMDPTTGTLSTEQMHNVLAAYQSLDGAKPKAAARAWIENGVKEALEGDTPNVPLARALNAVRGEITKAKGSSSKEPKAPADPTTNFVEQVVALQLAYSHVTQNVPDGVAEDWNDRAQKLAGETMQDVQKLAQYTGEGEEPQVSALARRALKLAQGKVSKGSSGGTRTPFTGTRRDIGKHILEAFADKNPGDFLTVAQIVSHNSAEYGDEHPSPGAVSARLFPKSGKCTLEGVEPVDAADGQPKGARKAA
jgi:hypothetical protein